jgi:hypothetical protein
MGFNIVSAEFASRWVYKRFEHLELHRIKTHFNDNGNHVRLISRKVDKRIHIKFSRELFNKFAVFHPEFAVDNEKGESINFDAVQDLKKEDIIIFAQPESISMIFYEDLQNKGVLRTNDKEGIQTWSIGVSNLDVIVA